MNWFPVASRSNLCMVETSSMQAIQSQFGHIIDVVALSENRTPLNIEANAQQRTQLVERLGLHDLEFLSARVSWSLWRSSGVRLTGTFRACVVQTCVVSLDLLTNHIEETFDLTFLPQKQIDDALRLDQDSFGQDVPEPLEQGRIDVGECMVQLLALALDPYPRKPAAQLPNRPHRHGSRDFVEINAPFGQEEKTGKGPFSALQRLKGQDD